jgi:putative peptidoglycan binding protein
MRKRNPDRGWRGVVLSALAAVCLSGATICLSGAAVAASSVPQATASDNAPAKQASPSKSTGASTSSAATHKTTTHKSSAHKPGTKAAAGKSSSHSSSSHRSSSSHGTSSSGQKTTASRGKKSSKNSRVAKKRGQQAIDRDRARAIQEALIREHYMNGEPSGTWDAATQAAMQRYQADQGWQSKTTPDSRALIKLGLGPSNDHLLNPESAMTSAPAPGDPKATTKANTAATPRPQQ